MTERRSEEVDHRCPWCRSDDPAIRLVYVGVKDPVQGCVNRWHSNESQLSGREQP